MLKKEPIANFALRQSRTPKNIQSGGKNALFCKLPNTIFSAYLRDTPPVHAAYRRVSREIAPAHVFISALAPAAASLFAPVAPRDAPKTANVCRGGAHHYFRGNVQRVASSVALARPDRPPIYRQTPRRKSQLAKVEKSVAERHAAARPKHKTGSPYVPYFEIPLSGESVTKK